MTIDVLYGLKIAFSSVYLDRIRGRVLYRGFENRSILKILLKKEKKKTCREYIFMQLRADILQSVFTVLFFKQGEKQGKTMYVDRRPKFSQFDPGF